MSLAKVEAKLGGAGDQEENREYLTHGELIADLRLIFSNAIAYNNPDRVVDESDRVSFSEGRDSRDYLYRAVCAFFACGGVE